MRVSLSLRECPSPYEGVRCSHYEGVSVLMRGVPATKRMSLHYGVSQSEVGVPATKEVSQFLWECTSQ